MNKQKLIGELGKIGIKVLKMEFSSAGYCLEVKLNKTKFPGWESLEITPIEGFEVIRIRTFCPYSGQLILVPAIKKEFKDYLVRHVDTYGMSKSIAIEDLKNIIETYAGASTKFNFGKYLDSLGGMPYEV